MLECYTCGEEITFDKNIRSPKGKQIPLYPDKSDAHGHDEDGNPIRQPLTSITTTVVTSQKQQQQQQQQQPPLPSSTTKSTTTVGGLTLDTKRLLQAVAENTKAINELKSIVDSRTIIDTSKYEQRINQIYNAIASEINKENFSTAAKLADRQDIIDITSINHAKIADQNIAAKYAKAGSSSSSSSGDEFERTNKFTSDNDDGNNFDDDAIDNFDDDDYDVDNEEKIATTGGAGGERRELN